MEMFKKNYTERERGRKKKSIIILVFSIKNRES